MWESQGCREREANDIRGKKGNAEKEKKASRGYESQGFGESWRDKEKSVGDDVSEEPEKKTRKEQGVLEERP